MARRVIDAGFDVVLWARRPESLEPYADTKATFANSVAELGAQVDFCGICVVDDNGVKDVFSQLLPAMSAGSLIAIHSTVTPTLCIQLAKDAAEKGITLIDAPVSGGGPGAEAGTLTVMAGGDPEAIEKLKPVFDTYSSLVAHLGDVGTGQYAKLVNNSMMAANLAVADHSFALADALGIDPKGFAELVRVSSGRSFAFEVRARMSQASEFAHGAKLLDKDVRLLGDALGKDSESYDAIRDLANQFLSQALDN